jgi:hypothetical protein
MRGADLLFMCGPNLLVALLPQTERRTADAMVRTIVEHLNSLALGEAGVFCRVGAATAPDDGKSFSEVLNAADAKARRGLPVGRASIH